jgi:hypothetical protein
MKNKLFYSLVFITLIQFSVFAQDKKTSEAKQIDNIYMTWNKNTPESEMNDDIKALKEHGVTISYSGVKRNANGEITSIKVDYTDKGGSNGSLSLNNQKPINTIKFYKQDDEMGFGEPGNTNFMMGDNLAGFDPDSFMQNFQFGNGENELPGQQFHFEFPEGSSSGESSSKIIIKKDGKKPLVIQDGNVVEGGDDYTKEELEDIKKNNKSESFSFNDGFGSTDMAKAKEEMLKAKEEMLKAKEEMENAKKELQKAKSLKTQKT